MENNGRKKHVVQGNVSEIKKQGTGLGEKKSSNREGGFLSKLIKSTNNKEKK